MASGEWLSIGQAAKRLGYGLTKMRELLDEERPAFDVIRVGPAAYRKVSVASLDEYLRVSRIRDRTSREAAIEALRRQYAGEPDLVADEGDVGAESEPEADA